MNTSFPDWLESWALAQGLSLEAAHRTGRLAIPLDRMRILLSRHTTPGWLVQARVTDLPQDLRLCEALVEKAAAVATARMAVSASALVMDPERSALWLQTHLPQDAGVAALEACLERLANDIEFWRAML